jgi:hypothetical protein
MKKEFKQYIVPLLLVLLSIDGWASEMYVKQKQLKFATKYTKGMYLDLSNQYGDVEILNTTSDSIKIIVDVTVNSKKPENTQSYLNNILVDFRTGAGYAIAETKWSGDADFFTKSYHAVKAGVVGEDNIVVNYKVYLPKSIELNIKNKFGNVYMESHSGRLTVNVAHGDFRARDLDHAKEIEVRFGKLKVNKLEDSKINLTSVSLAEIGTANSISLKSTSSDIEIDAVETLVLNSKHDEITIGKLGEVTGLASLSDIKIQGLSNSLKLDLKFGAIRIQKCNTTVSRLDISSVRTDVAIAFEESASASIEVLIDDKKYLYLGPSIKRISETPSSEASLRLKLQKGTTLNTLVNIKISKAYLEIGK